jgi:sigma-B regulation protein RsbU (phosphoserine phosphatase)
MQKTLFERIKGNLLEKRRNLSEWLESAPEQERQVHLGPADESAVQAHLHVLDTALEKASDGSLGLCDVCHEQVETALLETDYTACVCIEHFSTAEVRQLEGELELSQKLQHAMLPQQAPAIPGLELAFFNRPAQIVGGDYYDFIRFRDGTYGLVVADVVGHGVSASLLMASVHTLLHALIPESDSPSQVLERVNRLFIHNIRITTFVTVFLGQYDPNTGALRYCNAGHNPPLLVHNQVTGGPTASWLEPTAAAIGLIEDFQIAEKMAVLNPGDTLLIYTDGVTEAIDPQEQEFGYERLAGLVRAESRSSATNLVREVRRALLEHTGSQPLADDITIVACKRAEGEG